MSYLADTNLKHISSTPFTYMSFFPALLMDISLSLYQAICFPLYNIPKVKRQDNIVFDRQYLDYLNIIEKFICAYCLYINGLFGYLQEIGERTEQFWCPIKHTKRINQLHSRYQKFIEYRWCQKLSSQHEAIRHNFKDL